MRKYDYISMLAEEFEEGIDFPYIHEFNSLKTISLLGSHVSELSKQVLVEIERTIGAYGKEQEAQIGSYSRQKSVLTTKHFIKN